MLEEFLLVHVGLLTSFFCKIHATLPLRVFFFKLLNFKFYRFLESGNSFSVIRIWPNILQLSLPVGQKCRLCTKRHLHALLLMPKNSLQYYFSIFCLVHACRSNILTYNRTQDSYFKNTVGFMYAMLYHGISDQWLS